jgi:hypothetical protein
MYAVGALPMTRSGMFVKDVGLTMQSGILAVGIATLNNLGNKYALSRRIYYSYSY